MKENYFMDNLRYQLKVTGKKPYDISKDLGVSQTTVYKWVNGTRVPRYDSLKLLANYFNCDVSQLTDKPSKVEGKTFGARIPVLGSVQAGIPIDAIEEIIDYEEISNELARTGDFFALRIKGNSMEPRMHEGDVIIVKKQETIENGQLAVVLVNGNEGTVKRVMIRNDGIELISFNSEYPPMKYTMQDVVTLPVKIIGRVVECRQKY